MFHFLKLAVRRLRSEADYVLFQQHVAQNLRMDLEKQLVTFSNKRVIELGSGHGGYSDIFSKGTAYFVATDLAFGGGRQALDRVQLNLEKPFPFRDHEFDVAFCSNVIEHLERRREFYAEVRRVLKPSGTFIVTFPPFYSVFMAGGHHFKPFHFLGQRIAIRIYNLLHSYQIRDYRTSFGTFGLYPLTIKQVRVELADSGFQIKAEFPRMSDFNTMNWRGLFADLFTAHACFVLEREARPL